VVIQIVSDGNAALRGGVTWRTYNDRIYQLVHDRDRPRGPSPQEFDDIKNQFPSSSSNFHGESIHIIPTEKLDVDMSTHIPNKKRQFEEWAQKAKRRSRKSKPVE